MTTPAEFIDEIIENAITTADEQTLLATTAAQAIIEEANGLFAVSSGASQASTDVSAVEPDIPSVEDSVLTYEAQLANVVALLSDELAGFYTTYYPLASDAFDDATNWLINTITNGGTGIPADVENQIWQRDRDRLTSEARTLENQLIAGGAAKGNVLPSGAMNKAIQQVQLTKLISAGQSSTKVATKQVEIEIDNIKFAVEAALDSRFKAMNAAADYIRAVATSPGSAAQVASLNSDTQARMMSATSDLYRARLQRDSLIMNTDVANMGDATRKLQIYIDKHFKSVGSKVEATAQAANVFGGNARAALSSLNSVVSDATNSFE